jgi:hypothetical protein
VTRTSTPTTGPARLTWRTSSYSAGAGNCVEVADGQPELVPVRDSKCPSGPHLLVGQAAFAAFVRFVATEPLQGNS